MPNRMLLAGRRATKKSRMPSAMAGRRRRIIQANTRHAATPAAPARNPLSSGEETTGIWLKE
jgi:hypothetical protein